MGRVYKSSLKIEYPFKNNGFPISTYDIVESTDDLISTSTIPNPHQYQKVFVADTETEYRWNGSDRTNLDNWVAIKTSANQIFIEKDDYEALTSYTTDALYFVYEARTTVDKPEDETITYDGETYTLESTDAYTVTGDGGSDVGTYTFTVTLNSGYEWSDGTDDDLTITYTIEYTTVDKPESKRIVYDGDTYALESTDAYTVVGDGGSAIGTYTFTVTLNDNYEWSDGTFDELTIIYTIAETSDWYFGDTFPIVFSDGSSTEWEFGDSFPIIFS